jgi:hypothetical protein
MRQSQHSSQVSNHRHPTTIRVVDGSKLSDGRRPDCRLRRLYLAALPMATVKLARHLIGKSVVHDTDSGRLSGRIVEREAYPVGDAAGYERRPLRRRHGRWFLAPV